MKKDIGSILCKGICSRCIRKRGVYWTLADDDLWAEGKVRCTSHHNRVPATKQEAALHCIDIVPHMAGSFGRMLVFDEVEEK